MSSSVSQSPELEQLISVPQSPELEQLIHQEKRKAAVHEMIGKLTSACWDKCITGTPGTKFSSSDSSCLSHCAPRYLEMSLLIMNRLQQQ